MELYSNLRNIIIIGYLKPYRCVKIIHITLENLKIWIINVIPRYIQAFH